MKLSGIALILLLIALPLSAGCTQPSPASAPVPAATTAPGQAVPAAPETPAAATLRAPTETLTTIPLVPETEWKDSALHFAFRTPQDWVVRTRLMNLPEGSKDIMYITGIVANDRFAIITYPITLNQDQSYRDMFRAWDPAPVETTVRMNGITYDRFDSTGNGTAHVGYVVRKGSANDLGYASVIAYMTNSSHPSEQEDFEKAISTFRYFTGDTSDTVTGDEILRVR